MKQIKKHIKRLHKIKVHHNRWFIWTIVISAIVLFSLFYYIRISGLLFDSSLADPSILYKQGRQYKDNYLGFSVRYPLNWGIEYQTKNIIEFNDPYNAGQGFTVGKYELADQMVLRSNLLVSREQNVTVDDQPSTMLTLTPDAKDSSTIAVFVPAGDQLYLIKGNTPLMKNILATFNLNK